jgi:hypothetical protein
LDTDPEERRASERSAGKHLAMTGWLEGIAFEH